MIFVFHGDNQPKLREEFLRLKRGYGEFSFWEKELSELPAYLSSPSLFGQKELVAVENPELDQLVKLDQLIQPDKDLILLFPRRLPPRELAKFKGVQVATFWEEVPKNVFPFLDAIGGRNKKRAFSELHRLLEEGVDPDYLIKMVGWEITNLARVREKSTKGISPYVVAKFQKLVKNWSTTDLSQAFSLLLVQDLRQKKGKKVPLDFLVARLTERFDR